MGNAIECTKQKLLDLLAEEPTMVLSTAYIYAKNYANYGEDITKVWTTAVEQTSVIQKVKQKTWVEAYDSFKKEYETRLKADMAAMLTEIRTEIEEVPKYCMAHDTTFVYRKAEEYISDINKVIQQKIDSLEKET